MATLNAQQKITPFLWFNGNLEQAITFYTSVFKSFKLITSSRMPGEDQQKEGKLFTATFEIGSQKFMALNGGPEFNFSPAISFFINCDTQDEIDELWGKLPADGGKTNQCGWLDDKFGLTWQIVPSNLSALLYGNDPERSNRVMQALMKMTKLDIKQLQQAYDNQ